ncbi:hypothetical protein Tco_0588175 [Tanacetum coccineum]
MHGRSHQKSGEEKDFRNFANYSFGHHVGSASLQPSLTNVACHEIYFDPIVKTGNGPIKSDAPHVQDSQNLMEFLRHLITVKFLLDGWHESQFLKQNIVGNYYRLVGQKKPEVKDLFGFGSHALHNESYRRGNLAKHLGKPLVSLESHERVFPPIWTDDRQSSSLAPLYHNLKLQILGGGNPTEQSRLGILFYAKRYIRRNGPYALCFVHDAVRPEFLECIPLWQVIHFQSYVVRLELQSSLTSIVDRPKIFLMTLPPKTAPMSKSLHRT